MKLDKEFVSTKQMHKQVQVELSQTYALHEHVVYQVNNESSRMPWLLPQVPVDGMAPGPLEEPPLNDARWHARSREQPKRGELGV